MKFVELSDAKLARATEANLIRAARAMRIPIENILPLHQEIHYEHKLRSAVGRERGTDRSRRVSASSGEALPTACYRTRQYRGTLLPGCHPDGTAASFPITAEGGSWQCSRDLLGDL